MSIKILQDGFSIELKTGIRKVLWKEIDEINAYKVDMMTSDVICLDFILSESTITIPEETESWLKLVEEMEKAYPIIEKEWYTKVAFPAFETNFIVLYKRQ